jgi:hypothetical protein
MESLRKAIISRERGAALLIVLAFVVLLTGVGVAYLSRATSDRQVAQASFNQSKVDEVTASAMDLIIGDLQQEIVSGSSPTPTATPNISPLPTPTATPFVYPPLAPGNIVPMRNPTPTPGTTPAIANLIRSSVRSDSILYPGVPSRASAVNSTQASANGRLVTLPRWNKHYLIPRPAGASPTDTTPIAAFTAPDWVILTRNGPAAFLAWNSSLADPSQSNNSYGVGRYAYALYDEAGLLDANVVAFPSNTTTAQYGPKGVSAFADLTALGMSPNDIDAIVGWRNYFSAGPSGNFPNFNFNAAAATNYVASVLSNTNGFMSVPVPSSTPNNMSRTDQQFTMRQSLIQLVVGSLSSNAVNALQYVGTFSRELNAPSWAPTLNATDMGAPNNGTGNIYAYATNANSSTTINPNLLNVRVVNSFTRADGTTTIVGEPLINRRFPLTRLAGIGPTGLNTTANSTLDNGGVLSPASATTAQRDFGLQWDSTNNRWNYVGPSGSTVQTTIERLDQVAAENPGREPNFFELLKAAILSGSVGMGSGSANTFVASGGKYYNNTNNLSSDYQIMQIGANIINQWDSGNVPIFFNFYDSTANYELAGIKNLPYLSKLVFEPNWTTIRGHGGTPDTYQFDAWLLPSLWNPHQNAPPTAAQNVQIRIAMTSGALGAVTTLPSGTTFPLIAPSSSVNMTVNANAFSTSPSAPTALVGSPSTGIDNLNPQGYYGFHVAFATPAPTPPDTSSGTAYPSFGASGCNFELQVQVGGTWKTYQRWKGCAQPATPLVCQSPPPPKRWLDNTASTALQDPEFVALDPRTLRFGVWGNAANTARPIDGTTDYANGTQFTLDSPPTEAITALPPQGTLFSPSPSPSPTPSLYLYANNSDASVHYIDLDQVQRLGDFPTLSTTDEMQVALSTDRPLMLCGAYPTPTPSALQHGVFQSVAELGHVFRDQPWKTLTFTTAAPTAIPAPTPRSADAGLLDVFTLHESSMDAGKTSLNTKQPLVLKAILSQATKSIAGTTAITSTQRDNIVTALTNPSTGLQPIVNKAELVTRLAANSSVTGLGNKEARECVLRAFSDACQTRTWNLLIDVVAQSGRYPPNANTLAGFVVEGEQHYWVHVAIDRFTGQVIDKQIEVVNE